MSANNSYQNKNTPALQARCKVVDEVNRTIRISWKLQENILASLIIYSTFWSNHYEIVNEIASKKLVLKKIA